MSEEKSFEEESEFVRNLKGKYGKESWKVGWGWYILFFLIPPFGIADFLRTISKGIKPHYKALMISIIGIAFHFFMSELGAYDYLLSLVGFGSLKTLTFFLSWK